MAETESDVLVIGGGPAGLRAAEVLAAAGRRVTLADRTPSVGRKFLVAGRGGLNLTHSEPVENFPARYGGNVRWAKLLEEFSPSDLQAWAHALGVETFVGTSGRVFPMTKQAAPLLRRWLHRLRAQGVDFRTRLEWLGVSREKDRLWRFDFRGAEGATTIHARAAVLALGGGSWPQTGSNGAWVKLLTDAGVAVTPLAPANCGYEVAWSADFLARAEGKPLKNVRVGVGGEAVAGELLITRYGLEGGALYQLGRALRESGATQLRLDLKPTFSIEELAAKLGSKLEPDRLMDAARRAWKLSEAAAALLATQGPCGSARDLAILVKALPVTLRGPRPLAEAISSAGGVVWSELDEGLMLKRLPGIFCAGEMIDWEAPTGGYLLQGCFSTGTRAGRAAATWLDRSSAP